MPEGIGYANTTQAGLWALIKRILTGKSKKKLQEDLDLGIYPEDKLAPEYIRFKKIQNQRGLMAEIMRLEKSDKEKIGNIGRDRLTKALHREWTFNEIKPVRDWNKKYNLEYTGAK